MKIDKPHINPASVWIPGAVGYPGTPPQPLYPLEMSANEIAFWLNRVKTINIAGTVNSAIPLFPGIATAVNHNSTITFGGSACTTEEQAWQKGLYNDSVTYTGPGPYSLTIEFNFGGFFLSTGVDETKGWFPGISSLVSDNVGSAASYTGSTTAGLGIVLMATDPVTGQVYNATLPMFGSAPPSGTLIISPEEYWPYGGVYDPFTGALV